MPSKRVRRKEIHYLSPTSRVGSHILINIFIHHSYDHTPSLVYFSKTTGDRTLGPTLHNCLGRQAVVRFCNSGGLPPKRSFSVHLHGSASTSAYGRSYSIFVTYFFHRRNLECPWRTLSHHICSRRWLGRRYNWPRPGESISAFHCYLIYGTLFTLLTSSLLSASHSARTMCIPIIGLHIFGTTIIRKFWETACPLMNEISHFLSYPAGLIIRQITTTKGW